MDEHEGNRFAVPCPTCGNDDIDTLVWDDPRGGADFVTCLVCGTRYDPITGEFQKPF
jgi:ribosomal protein S27E